MQKRHGWPERVVFWLVTLVFVTASLAKLAITMVVGAGFHITYDTPPEAVPAFVLAFLSLLVVFMRRRRKTVAPA